MTQMPTLSPFSTPNPIGTIFGSVGDGMWLAATSSPWVGAVFCLLIVSVMARVYRAVRWAPIAAAGLDPLRRFIGVDRAAILSRAGNRCERHSLLFGRCKETEKLHADHVHPHSKGGSTTVVKRPSVVLAAQQAEGRPDPVQLGAAALREAANFVLSGGRQRGSRPARKPERLTAGNQRNAVPIDPRPGCSGAVCYPARLTM